MQHPVVTPRIYKQCQKLMDSAQKPCRLYCMPCSRRYKLAYFYQSQEGSTCFDAAFIDTCRCRENSAREMSQNQNQRQQIRRLAFDALGASMLVSPRFREYLSKMTLPCTLAGQVHLLTNSLNTGYTFIPTHCRNVSKSR
jgi:hypothetical protein